ncbi:hypothetical protein BWR19_11150 [Halomonas sp. 1513]|nr:hypothetical protein BWR19_11150 [Halomonas sp. 1513]
MPTKITLNHLRRYAISRSLFKPRALQRAITKLGFVQFDPIRAPARAQDLTLRHRVTDYRAGELESRYPRLAVEEDFFVNYGILPRFTQCMMHPRTTRTEWPPSRWAQARAVLEFVQSRAAADGHAQPPRHMGGFFGGSAVARAPPRCGVRVRVA